MLFRDNMAYSFPLKKIQMTSSHSQFEKAKNAAGFIAALDQSGGSTPKALRLYGVKEDAYDGEAEMFDKVHAMRTRIMTNASFIGNKILGAILFENTMDRAVDGLPTARYLWESKNILPFLKVDKGLADEEAGVQVMKPMPTLEALLQKAVNNGVFGTKMRSVIKLANEAGINRVVQQQFDVGKQIIAHGLIPIIEPEVDIHSPEKSQAEHLLRDALMNQLDLLSQEQRVMFKLTLPEHANFYRGCVEHPNIIRVVALSGGYSRAVANQRLSENNGMIASFSRALTEGLSIKQTETAFTTTLATSIDSIAAASAT